MKSCIIGAIAVFNLVSLEECLHLDQYNVTFPCGRPEDKQRCRFPQEYCDTTQESCLQCNEDICREQDSDPSCRAFCYHKDLEHPETTSTEGKSMFFSHAATITFFVGCVALVIAILSLIIYMIRKRRETNNMELNSIPHNDNDGNDHRRTENNNIVGSPTS